MSKRHIIVDGPWRRPLIDWFAARVGDDLMFGPGENGTWHTDDARTIAHVIDDGGPAREENVLVVVLFNNWTPATCEGNIASDGTKRWFSRKFAHATYSYVFEHGGRSRINFTVSPDNKDAIAMHESLGHKFEARLEDAYGEGRDALLYGYTKRQWLKGPWYSPPTDK